MSLRTSTEASRAVEAERCHPSTSKPGPRSKTSLIALAAHQQSAALQPSHSSLTEGCVRAPCSTTEPYQRGKAALALNTLDAHTTTNTQSLETSQGFPQVAASSACTQLQTVRIVRGHNIPQTTTAPTAVLKTMPAFSGATCLKCCPSRNGHVYFSQNAKYAHGNADTLRSTLAPTISHPVNQVHKAAKQASSVPQKTDERRVPPIDVQLLVNPTSSCTCEVGGHPMMVPSTAPAVLETTVASAVHSEPAPRALLQSHVACPSR